MAESDEADRRKRRLNWEGTGSPIDLSNLVMDALMARGGEFVSWLHQMGEDRPLIRKPPARQASNVILRTM